MNDFMLSNRYRGYYIVLERVLIVRRLRPARSRGRLLVIMLALERTTCYAALTTRCPLQTSPESIMFRFAFFHTRWRLILCELLVVAAVVHLRSHA